MSASSPPAVAAGQEPHNDAAEGHHAADNSLQDAADAADNCHDAIAYRGENGLNLQSRPSAALSKIGKEKKEKKSPTHAREYAAHGDSGRFCRMNVFNSVKVGYVFQKAMEGLEGKIEKEEESRKPSVTQVRANVFIPRHLHLTSPNLVLPKQPKHADCRLTSTPRKTPGTRTPDLETQKKHGHRFLFFFRYPCSRPVHSLRGSPKQAAVSGSGDAADHSACRVASSSLFWEVHINHDARDLARPEPLATGSPGCGNR